MKPITVEKIDNANNNRNPNTHTHFNRKNSVTLENKNQDFKSILESKMKNKIEIGNKFHFVNFNQYIKIKSITEHLVIFTIGRTQNEMQLSKDTLNYMLYEGTITEL